MSNIPRSNEELVRYLVSMGYLRSENIIKAFLEVDRKDFVHPYFQNEAYLDYPLPVLPGKYTSTISAPSIVAIMTELLEPKRGDKILEIGTGSGYQAAILSKIVGENGLVVTVEIDKDVYKFAKKNLENYKNVIVILGDGKKGYPEYAPYDKIIVTAAADKIYDSWIEQLKENGILIGPFEEKFGQVLKKITKRKDKLEIENVLDVIFVKLR